MLSPYRAAHVCATSAGVNGANRRVIWVPPGPWSRANGPLASRLGSVEAFGIGFETGLGVRPMLTDWASMLTARTIAIEAPNAPAPSNGLKRRFRASLCRGRQRSRRVQVHGPRVTGEAGAHQEAGGSCRRHQNQRDTPSPLPLERLDTHDVALVGAGPASSPDLTDCHAQKLPQRR